MGVCGTILVVDHDDVARAAAVAIVERLGYLACEAENAESVLDRPGGVPALAIVEVELPDRRAASSSSGSCTRSTAWASR